MYGRKYYCEFAALIAIPYSYFAPASYAATNIQGTLNMLEAAKNARHLQQFIQISTSEVYGTALYTPIDEKHPLQPQSPYSATKIASDSIALSYHNSYGLPVTIARPFNTFGPRQSARAFIPSFTSQALSENKVIKVGDTTTIRNMNYVRNTCEGIFSLFEQKKSFGEVFNIGSSHEEKMSSIASKILKFLDIDKKIETELARIRPKNSEVHRLVCESEKLNQLTGFSPEIDFDDGLKLTVDWLRKRENLSNYNPHVYTI